MSEYTTSDMVGFALEKKPEDFKTAFADIMLDKIADAIDAKKQEVAKTYFNYEASDEEEVGDNESETEEQDGQDTEENA